MTRGYKIEDIRQKLINLLSKSKIGLSGVEISKKLGINRITMTKYLKIFAAEGTINQKNIGNLTLWSIEDGVEQFQFPDDYFQITPKFIDALNDFNLNQALSLIRNCIRLDATVSKLVTEVILPTITSVRKSYEDGKIGNSEIKLLYNFISDCIQILKQVNTKYNQNKNVIVISGDSESDILSEATSSVFHSEGWRVFHLGNMSSNINVLFDLDLQKLLGKIWKQKPGIMVVVVLSYTEEGLNFFANSINSIKKKVGKNLHLVLYGQLNKKTKIESDLISKKLEDILQWSQTVFERYEAK